MAWGVYSPMDKTYYTGTIAGAIGWSSSAANAVPYPTYHQAVLALLIVDRAYDGVGYYTTKVVELNSPAASQA